MSGCYKVAPSGGAPSDGKHPQSRPLQADFPLPFSLLPFLLPYSHIRPCPLPPLPTIFVASRCSAEGCGARALAYGLCTLSLLRKSDYRRGKSAAKWPRPNAHPAQSGQALGRKAMTRSRFFLKASIQPVGLACSAISPA